MMPNQRNAREWWWPCDSKWMINSRHNREFRRYPTELMRILIATLLAAIAVAAHAGGPQDRVVIHLLDPRGAIAGEQTMPTEWNGGKTDLIATRHSK
tara:strand:- start:5392 stop:5682 length:291 start_codon:yes stop_codon:yes gene_type:complete